MRINRIFAGAAAVGVLLLGTGGVAFGALTPDDGPVSGGTTVTMEAPEITFESVSTGFYHSLAIGSDGRTYAWGSGDDGVLGNGSTLKSSTIVAVDVPEGVTFTSVAAGLWNSYAIGSDGNTYAWGGNLYGQLGTGSYSSSTTPVKVTLPEGVTFTSVAAGDKHALATGSDGNVYAWGGGSGLLGDGTLSGSEIPVKVETPAGVTFSSVAAGYDHSLALGNNGRVYAWGWNDWGQLGNGPTLYSLTPVEVTLPDGVTVTSIAAGYGHSLAVASDGTVYGWGWNKFGQLGENPDTASSYDHPIAIAMPDDAHVVGVAGSRAHSLAVDNNGKVYAWGNNDRGQLGNRSDTDLFNPEAVELPVDAISVAAGFLRSLILGDDGNIYSWGNNDQGQLGNGTTISTADPVAVATVTAVTGITFDGIPGTTPGNLDSTLPADNGDGTWSVVTPAHNQGAVDVVVSWTLNGNTQKSFTLPSRFTYDPPVSPTVSDPVDVSVVEGDSASFSVEVSGVPVPDVGWEVSTDGGSSWVPVSEGVSDDGLTLVVTGVVLSDDGNLYRARVTNEAGSVVSEPAELTVTKPVPGGSEQGGSEQGGKHLAVTGLGSSPFTWIVGLTALVLGGSLVAQSRAIRRRFDS